MTYNEQKSCDPTVISNMFADFFQSVYKREDVDEYKNPSSCESNLSIHVPTISIEDIKYALKNFGDGCGPDSIPASVLKENRALELPLCLIFNQSLRVGEFPQLWKTTRITPIFKAGDRNNVSCYRGISSISSIPKLFELVVCNCFKAVVSSHISPSQHGFMPKRSTSTNLVEFVSSTIKEIENHRQVDVVYTDFSKAFDSISHCKALESLYNFGFSHNFIIWFKSYLSERFQYIEMGNKKSKSIKATSGVPQGSHIGPWIFTIFINSITEVIQHSKLLMFPDDLKIYKSVESINDTYQLQEDINSLLKWCDSHLLNLNISKCKMTSFRRKVTPVESNYRINGIQLQKVAEITDLGVTFTEKANSMLGFIKRWIGDIYEISTIKILYYAYVRPSLEYAVTVWCPFYHGDIRKIEGVQKQFVRFITWKDGWIQS